MAEDGRLLDILLQLYNEGFVQGEIGIGNDQEATSEALKAIRGVVESYNSIDYPYGADFKQAILKALS